MADLATAEQEILEFIGLYEDQTEDVIWDRRAAWANEGITEADVNEWTDVREGTMFYTVTIGGVREDARIYDLMGTEVVAAASPLYAWSRYLDAHAAVQQLERQAAVAATGTVQISATTDDPGPVAVFIPANTPVGVEPANPDQTPIEFELLSSVSFTAGDAPVDVDVRATEPGVAGSVPAGAVSVIDYDPGVPVTLIVSNTDPIRGGAETEDDTRLRRRLLTVYGGIGGWNKRAFEAAALSYGQGIGRATVIPRWDGPNTVKVIVSTEEGDPVSSDTVDGLQALLDPTPGLGHGEVTVGLEVTVETVATLNVTVGGFGAGNALEIELEEGFSLAGGGGTVALGPLIVSRITAYAESVRSGGEVVRAQVISQAASVRGVHDVGLVKLNTVAANLAVDDDPPQAPAVVAVNLVEATV